ncbi:MAG: 3-oxoacyl-ACP synthase [Polaribacter sp.]|nr:3-oxoacyl-ACP synthase [Polaribacter sp.]
MNLKEKLFKQCELFVNNRMDTVEQIISSNQKALQSENKSSAGDKHETGRAMLQLEIEKASQQFKAIRDMRTVLAKIDLVKESKIAHLGSVIETSSVCFFLAISVGKITAYGKDYFAVSVFSPIGKLLLGKQKGEEFIFNGVRTKIRNVV